MEPIDSPAISPMEYAEQNRAYTINLRRAFHACPELAFQEYQTSEKICAELDRLGIPFHKLRGTGVVAAIGEGKPVIGIRADIDGLPITEKSDIPY
ncbi:MAG: amidohydrolase, partial [Defluviitaleaceae bacterium]|nr:amidohydrolase [Defluviitaleaceae bacterium]